VRNAASFVGGQPSKISRAAVRLCSFTVCVLSVQYAQLKANITIQALRCSFRFLHFALFLVLLCSPVALTIQLFRLLCVLNRKFSAS